MEEQRGEPSRQSREPQKGRMTRGVLYTSGSQLLIQAMGLATGIMVARILGPSGRGQLAAVISWGAMMAYLGNLGLPSAFAYAAARHPKERRQLFGNGIAVTCIQWLLLTALGWVVLPMALGGHGKSTAHLAMLYLFIYVPLNLVTLYANSIQQGSGSYARFNAVRLTVPVTYLAGIVILLLLHGLSVRGVVFSNLTSNASGCLLALFLVVTYLRRVDSGQAFAWFSRKALSRDLRYGLKAQIGALQPFTGLRLDVLALTMLIGLHQLGLYVAALAAANILRAQGFALGQVVFPEVAKRQVRVEQWNIIVRFIILAAIGGAAAVIVVFMAANWLLREIYGEAFVAAAPMLKILTIAGAIGAVYRVLADGLRGLGRPGASTVAELVAVIVGIPALILAGRFYGPVGASVAVLAMSTTSVVVVLWSGRGSGYRSAVAWHLGRKINRRFGNKEKRSF